MRLIIAIAFVLILISSAISLAQMPLSSKNKKAIELYTEADNYRVRGQLTQAIQLLNQAIAKDKQFVEAYYRLGLVYMSSKDYNTAIQNFEQAIAATSDVKKHRVIWFDLGESYFTIGNYEQAERYLQQFVDSSPTVKAKADKAKLLLSNITFAKSNAARVASIRKRKLSDTVNNFVLQYFPVLTADQQQMIFTRRIGDGAGDDEDLVVSTKKQNGSWDYPESISENINSQLNEGTCTISADGRRLIFTSCTGRGGFGSCDLYESIRTGDVWSKPRNLGAGVNSGEWESQPSLSADGRTLYFVSDRRSGIGRRDIWMSVLDEKGEWSKAKNLGANINTLYDEISPFIHVNNRTLYYATNGLPGFGGYDLFYCIRDTASTWSAPVNLGSPINNHEDQFALFVTADGKKGYYSHEEVRPAGYSASFIYEMEIPKDLQMKARSNYVKGIVRDRATKHPLAAEVELVNIVTNQRESFVQSDSITGQYLIVLTEGSEYALYVNKNGYLFESLNFDYTHNPENEPVQIDFFLDRIEGGKSVVLNNLFFDVDSYELRKTSQTELEHIVRFLNASPATQVEIGGHTDNQGQEAYNLQLSLKRASEVRNFLSSRVKNPERIIVKGYGSKKPVADNGTDGGRRLNRRIEFRIVSSK